MSVSKARDRAYDVEPRFKNLDEPVGAGDWRGIRHLRPDEERPAGEPRRYVNNKGYVRLRWKVGNRQYVETYERDAAGDLVREMPRQDRRIDDARAIELYQSGWSTTEVGRELGCSGSAVSRVLARHGVPARPRQAPRRPYDLSQALDLYRGGMGVEDVARSVNADPQRLAKDLRAAGARIRKPGRPRGKRARSYKDEFEKARPKVHERAAGACEARTPQCVGRVDHVHHIQTRGTGGGNELTNLLGVCTPCHGYIHNHPNESYEQGWLRRSTP